MPQVNNRRAQSFEPRVGVAQLIFGLIYAFITGIAIVLAFKVYEASGGQQPWLQYFFVILFAIMAVKSFFIYAHTKILYSTGMHTVGVVESIDPNHGITIVRGSIKLDDGRELSIESRFAGESVAHEIRHFLDEQKTKKLPALVVDIKGKRPRGMFVIHTYAGHLDEEYKNQLIVDKK
ncbi:MAG: hypothetical protein Q4E81_03255 [Succinatimonas sp.]|nr:hypothetical protein [Succinatimonas sp.]